MKVSRKKRVLIVTLDDYLLYQPTILNLYDALQHDFDPAIVSVEPASLGKNRESRRRVHYIEVNPLFRFLLQNLDFVLFTLWKWIGRIFGSGPYRFIYYSIYLPFRLRRKLRRLESDLVIAVDITSLAVCQQVYGRVHFLFLEIPSNNPFLRKIDKSRILSVLIQHQDRFRYLFGSQNIPCFIVQNAPIFTGPPSPVQKIPDFIWAGSIIRKFAVLECIRFFESHPSFKLVLKGGGDKKTREIIQSRYAELLDRQIIRIDEAYVPGDQFVRYLSQYRVGFCFYAWSLIESDFNYQTAPSGKLFMYLAAGVPVIACDIPGFQFIREMSAGVLVRDYEPSTILEAVRQIESRYDWYVENCFKAARLYSFDNMVAPYLKFLLEQG